MSVIVKRPITTFLWHFYYSAHFNPSNFLLPFLLGLVIKQAFNSKQFKKKKKKKRKVKAHCFFLKYTPCSQGMEHASFDM